MTVRRSSFTAFFLALGWLVVALTVLLVPAPREWGRLGPVISPYYDRIQHQLEPAVHIVLMASVAVLIMYILKQEKAPKAFALTMVVSMLLAVSLEGLQKLLPAKFGRECDIHDLLPAVIGISAGCLLGLVLRTRKH